MLWGKNIIKALGFTLVEMMITLLIVAAVLVIGVPSFSTLIKNNRMLSLVYELRAALNDARSEALAQRTFVTFCSSNDGASCSGTWKDGFIAFRDTDGNGKVDNPDKSDGDQVFIAKVLHVAIDKFTYSANGNLVRFDSRGYATDFSGTFTLCDDRGAEEARGVIVTSAGIVRAPEDRDNSRVLLDHAGNALDCK
jgi:type IV fimbrial biogenesis protein FimT